MTAASCTVWSSSIFKRGDTNCTRSGGVLTLESYENDYRYTEAEATRVQSLANGLQQLGAFVACFLIWPITHK